MFKSQLWMFTTIFALGAIAGFVYLLNVHGLGGNSTDNRGESGAEGEGIGREPQVLFQLGEQYESDPQIAAGKLLTEGDNLLAAGNVLLAENRYALIQKVTGKLSNEVSLRLAICAELTRQPDKAARHYRRVIQSNPPAIHRWLALSGIGRSWIERGNRTEALQILLDLLIDSMGTAMPEEIQAQVFYQLGMTLEDISLQSYHYDLTQGDGVLFQYTLPRVEDMLKLVDGQHLVATEVDSGYSATKLVSFEADDRPNDGTQNSTLNDLPSIRLVQRPSAVMDLTIVDIESPIVPITELVKQLAATCEIELFGSEIAQSAIAGRAKSIRANSVHASIVLDSLLLPFNVIWFQDSEGLHLISLEESRKEAARYFPLAMERFYRKLNLSFPGDYRTASALLSRANLKFIQGEVDLAAAHYQELLQRSPQGEFLAKLFFNVGKVEMRLGRTSKAIQQFYLTVDQTYDASLEATAYWMISQLCLEMQRLPESIKTGGRALALARLDSIKRLAAMTMARAYLLENQPLSANQVLFDNRRVFEGSPGESSAAILGSFARYLVVTDKFSLNAEANRLLAALANAKEEEFEHFLDVYIAARAWQRLGFRDKGIELLKLTVESTTITNWRNQFLFELAIQLKNANSIEEALAMLEYLVSADEGVWQLQAMLHLTELYLERDRVEESLQLAYQLLSQEMDDENKHKLLHLMGRGYRMIGQHHSAALCFAGMIPKLAIDDTSKQ